MAKSKSKLKIYIYIYIAELHNHRAQMTHSLHKNSYQKNIDLENLNTSLIKGYIKNIITSNVIKIKPFKELRKEGLKVELGFNRNLKCDEVIINCNTNKWI